MCVKMVDRKQGRTCFKQIFMISHNKNRLNQVWKSRKKARF